MRQARRFSGARGRSAGDRARAPEGRAHLGHGAGRPGVRRVAALSEPIPVTVIGGYLGAGKTTLVNHLLRHANGLRIAVLLNDFGDLPIDADLIESREGEVIGIAGGCVCCSFGSDLVAALSKLPQREPRPQHVLVETSGVALPAAVARSVALLPSYRLDATVVLADAETVRTRAADRYLGDTITRQLAGADLVLLNKTDLVRLDELTALGPWIREHAPGARVVVAERAQVPLAVLLGSESPVPRRNPGSPMSSGKIANTLPAAAAMANFASLACRPEHRLDVSALGKALADPALGVLRAKGRLRDLDGTWKTLHVVGSRCEVTATRIAAQSPGLTCIGLAGAFDRRAVEQAVARAYVPAAG